MRIGPEPTIRMLAKVGALRHAAAIRSKKGRASSGPGAASGWNWTLAKSSPASPSTRAVVERDVADELARPRPRRRSRGSATVTSTRPARALAHRVVRAAVAEGKLERPHARARGRRAGGRGRCRRAARARAARAPSRPGSASTAGSPGPFADEHRRGRSSRIASASQSPGTTSASSPTPRAGGDRALAAEVDDDHRGPGADGVTARRVPALGGRAVCPSIGGSASASAWSSSARRLPERAAHGALGADPAHERARVDLVERDHALVARARPPRPAAPCA